MCMYIRIEANEFSAIFIQVTHYDDTKVSAADVEKLTDKLNKYGSAVLGKETPFVTMVMRRNKRSDSHSALGWRMCAYGSAWPLSLLEILVEDSTRLFEPVLNI